MNQFARTDFNLQLFVKDQKKKKKWASIIQVKSYEHTLYL